MHTLTLDMARNVAIPEMWPAMTPHHSLMEVQFA
jgi:hypothetical protein